MSPLLCRGIAVVNYELFLKYDEKYDLNKDGYINALDFSIFSLYYGKVVKSYDSMSAACDFNGDGRINALDFALFQEHYGGVKYMVYLYPHPVYSTPSGWADLTAPLNATQYSNITLGWIWKNTLPRNAQGHVTCIVTKPDGTQAELAATAGQDITLGEGESVQVEFAPLTLDQFGNYTATARLETEDFFDETTISLASVGSLLASSVSSLLALMIVGVFGMIAVRG